MGRLDVVDRRDLWRGLRLTWLHVPRGGYGYAIPVPVTVVTWSGDRVRVAAELARGGTKKVTVMLSSLRGWSGGHAPISPHRVEKP